MKTTIKKQYKLILEIYTKPKLLFYRVEDLDSRMELLSRYRGEVISGCAEIRTTVAKLAVVLD